MQTTWQPRHGTALYLAKVMYGKGVCAFGFGALETSIGVFVPGPFSGRT